MKIILESDFGMDGLINCLKKVEDKFNEPNLPIYTS